MAPMNTVELHQAFLWTCDDCGRDNFARAVTLAPESVDPDDLPGDLADEVREWVESGGDGAFLASPDRVTCDHCGATFRAEPS